MTFRVSVERHDVLRDGVVVAIGQRSAEIVRVVTALTKDGPEYATVEPFTTNPHTLFLPGDLVRPLLDALAQHYVGHSDLRQLREDYLAERRRVDKFIEHHVRSPQPGAPIG